MRCFVLAFSVLAFSSTCVFSNPAETDDQSDAFSIKLASAACCAGMLLLLLLRHVVLDNN